MVCGLGKRYTVAVFLTACVQGHLLKRSSSDVHCKFFVNQRDHGACWANAARKFCTAFVLFNKRMFVFVQLRIGRYSRAYCTDTWRNSEVRQRCTSSPLMILRKYSIIYLVILKYTILSIPMRCTDNIDTYSTSRSALKPPNYNTRTS